jgi:hypothetical protein
MPKRKRRLVRNEDGVLVDEVAIRQRQREAARKAEKEKAAKAQARHRKGKATRPNYKSMLEAEYILVRRNNWYATARDEDIEDRGFWNEEQWGIFCDVYEPSRILVVRCILLTLITFAARPILIKLFLWLRRWG